MSAKRGLILFIIYFSLGYTLGSGIVSTAKAVIAANTKSEKKVTPTCKMVDGKDHIYRNQCLPEGFTPEVVMLSPRASWLNTKQYLDIRAKVLVEQLIEEAEKDGMCLVVTSGYRSYEEQKDLYDNAKDKSIAAKPGESEHQTGLAVDFAACPMKEGIRNDGVERTELVKNFEDLPEYKWLHLRAFRYGFEQSYNALNAQEGGYPVESWHWKLVLE